MNEVIGGRVEGKHAECGPKVPECRNHQKCTEVHEDVRRSGNRVAEDGFEYFCSDYVSKNGVSVTECNSIPPQRPRLEVQ